MLSALIEVSAQRSHLKLELRSQLGQKVYFMLGNMNIAPELEATRISLLEEIQEALAHYSILLYSGCDHPSIFDSQVV